MQTKDESKQKIQELMQAYEKFSLEMKKITDQQNELLKELLTLYTSIKLDDTEK